MATARAPYEPFTVGADIGNATTSIARPDGVVSFFPSVYAYRVRPYDGLSKITTSQHHVTYNGRHAVIGSDAMEMNGSDTLLRETGEAHKRYTEDQSFMCFLAGVSAAFPTTDTVGVRLATGAPLSIFEAHGPDIARRYIGTHEYIYNGHRRRVVVEGVQVYGEGRETLRLLPEAERAGNVAVHDLGGKTWNVLLFKDGMLRAFRTFEAGTERLLDDIPSVSKDPAERWALQVELRKNPKAHAAIRAELDKVIALQLDVIERKVALGKADRHALIGGGAVYLPGALKARYKVPTAILNGDSPEGANALAYALAASEVR
jgi:hypothetical protein